MSGERAWLCLADGTRYAGVAFGAPGVAVGEAVFTTGMTGYQEVLTDPSYTGQLVAMTAPQIGNTGCNAVDPESLDLRPKVAGFVVRELSAFESSWRAEETLHDYLARTGVVAIGEVDTRELTRHLRARGAQNAAIGTAEPDVLIRRAQAAPAMEGLDLVERVTPPEPYEFAESSGAWRALMAPGATLALASAPLLPPSRHVVVLDLGIKRNILRCLVDVGCRITAVPARTSAQEILALRPDGIFVSNGPGDPQAVTYAVETLRALLGKAPMFGICLGHQLMALALGATTYKLKFGHRGTNQPVKDLDTGRVEITTQNHGFCVELASLAGRARSTHVHL
ncbi:MAG: carbamoyl-phosphate synthase small subunit, partial [Myxococcales bacterium]|nr:carbamoyl-phosphate synthase small subunit [Myxococcales bacterium]